MIVKEVSLMGAAVLVYYILLTQFGVHQDPNFGWFWPASMVVFICVALLMAMISMVEYFKSEGLI